MSITYSLAITLQNRKIFKKLIDSLSLEQLNGVPTGFNNNIIWNMAHVVAVQQILIYGLTSQPFTTDKSFVDAFSPGTRPSSSYDDHFVKQLQSLLFSTHEQLVEGINQGQFLNFNTYMTALKFEINDLDSALAFNQYHEALHMGHILNIRKFL